MRFYFIGVFALEVLVYITGRKPLAIWQPLYPRESDILEFRSPHRFSVEAKHRIVNVFGPCTIYIHDASPAACLLGIARSAQAGQADIKVTLKKTDSRFGTRSTVRLRRHFYSEQF